MKVIKTYECKFNQASSQYTLEFNKEKDARNYLERKLNQWLTTINSWNNGTILLQENPPMATIETPAEKVTYQIIKGQ